MAPTTNIGTANIIQICPARAPSLQSSAQSLHNGNGLNMTFVKHMARLCKMQHKCRNINSLVYATLEQVGMLQVPRLELRKCHVCCTKMLMLFVVPRRTRVRSPRPCMLFSSQSSEHLLFDNSYGHSLWFCLAMVE